MNQTTSTSLGTPPARFQSPLSTCRWCCGGRGRAWTKCALRWRSLRAATLARQKAEADLRDLYRERAIAEGSRVLS